MSTESNRRLVVARSAGALAAGVSLAGAGVRAAAAHHSYPATYDTARSVTVRGSVQLVRYTNPHVHIVIETLVEPAPPPADTEAPPDTGAPPPDAETAVYEYAALTTQPLAQAPASTLWLLDLPAPSRAQRIGLTPESVPVGTPVTVVAWPSRSPGSHDLAPLTITFDESGRTIQVR